MVRSISAREAQASFDELLELVHNTGESIVVHREGRPCVAIVSAEKFARSEEAQEWAWAVIEQIQQRNADKDPDEVLADVTTEVEAVRREMYEERQQAREGSR